MKLILYILFLLVSSTTCGAQSKYRTSLQDYYLSQNIRGARFFKRLSISGGLHFITGKVDIDYKGIADTYYREIKTQLNIKSQQSYVGYVGSYFPVTIISDNSMLVANIELMASYSKLGYDSISLTSKRRFCIPQETYRVGLPISLEYHVGSDVLLNKMSKTMFSIGGGVCPTYLYSNDNNYQSPVLFTPFIKGEVGFFAGLAFKFRAMYYFGSIKYGYSKDYNIADRQNILISDFKGSAGFNISLVILPFSYSWTK